MTTAGSVYPALRSSGTLEIRGELEEWLKGFKDVPYEDSSQSLQFVPQRWLREQMTALHKKIEIHPLYQKIWGQDSKAEGRG